MVLNGGTATVNYSNLTIEVAHSSAQDLDPVFANNVSNPVQVLSGSQSVTFNDGAWSPIWFGQPFAYNGLDNLVLDIRKDVQSATAPNVYHSMPILERADLPRMRVADSSGGTLANAGLLPPMRLRLHFGTNPILELGSNFDPATGYYFRRGTHLWLELHGNSSWSYAVMLELAGPTLPTASTLPGIAGHTWLGSNGALVFPLASGVQWSSSPIWLTVQIPPIPALAGTHIAVQYYESHWTGTAAWSNYADAWIR